jgi:GAF domain-containing protein
LHDFLFVLQTLPHDKMMDTVKEMFVRLQQYHTLLSEADKITVDLNRDDTLYGVIERLDALVTSQDVFAFLVNHENGACECVASKHALQNGYVLPKGAGLPGWVVKHEASVRVADAQKDARFAPTTQSKLKDLAKGVLAVPVTDKDFRVIGVLMLCNKVNGSFTQDDLTMVEFIALLAGHAIEHALLYDEILVKQDDTEMLMQMQEVISGQQDRKKVFERVREAVAVLVPSDRVRVWVLDHEKQEMQLFEPSTSTSRATTPRLEGKKLSPKKKKQTQRDTHVASEGKTSFSPFVKPLVTNVPLGRGVLGFTLRSVQTSNFSNPLKDFRFDPTWDMRDPSLPIRNMLCVPVVNQDGQPVAIVECVNCVGNTDGYTKQHELLLESLAISAGACVHKIDLYEQAVQRQQQMEVCVCVCVCVSIE